MAEPIAPEWVLSDPEYARMLAEARGRREDISFSESGGQPRSFDYVPPPDPPPIQGPPPREAIEAEYARAQGAQAIPGPPPREALEAQYAATQPPPPEPDWGADPEIQRRLATATEPVQVGVPGRPGSFYYEPPPGEVRYTEGENWQPVAPEQDILLELAGKGGGHRQPSRSGQMTDDDYAKVIAKR